MKVILKDYIVELGQMGDIVEVAAGYGRNYLLPRGLAVRATTDNLSRLEHERASIGRHKEQMHSEAEAFAAKLDGHRCTIAKAVSEAGNLYGSVTAIEVEALLHESGFSQVNRRQLGLDGPIKEVGEFQVPVRVHPEVTATITVEVVALVQD